MRCKILMGTDMEFGVNFVFGEAPFDEVLCYCYEFYGFEVS